MAVTRKSVLMVWLLITLTHIKMAKKINYLEKMKKGVLINSIISTIFILLLLGTYFCFDSVSAVPLFLKIIFAISGVASFAMGFYTKYHILVCPFCHKPFESSLKHRLSGTKVIPHRCPNCGVVIDYTIQ